MRATVFQIKKHYAKENDFRNVKIFIDDGISGVTFNRQGFKEMYKLIESA